MSLSKQMRQKLSVKLTNQFTRRNWSFTAINYFRFPGFAFFEKNVFIYQFIFRAVEKETKITENKFQSFLKDRYGQQLCETYSNTSKPVLTTTYHSD
jgi:hypothetical protein